MAFRGKEMMKLMKKVGEHNLGPGLKDSLKKCIPDNSKVIMGRAKRGLFAGRHIQFGNRVSEDGGNKTRRAWKPNVQEKRLFSYILDRHIQVKVTVHALRCIDKAGGIDEYLLKTPYHKMDSEMGLFWKTKIEKLYKELGQMEAVFFSPEERAARREAKRKMIHGGSGNPEQIKEGRPDDHAADEEAVGFGEGCSDVPEQLVANN